MKDPGSGGFVTAKGTAAATAHPPHEIADPGMAAVVFQQIENHDAPSGEGRDDVAEGARGRCW